MYSGCLVAMITPFQNGEIDEPGLRRLVEFHLQNGTDGLVPCGTTGESVSMTEEEQLRVIEIVVETVNKRIPVIAGTGTNSTAKTIKMTKKAQKVGADAALVVTPYYNKPTQQGLYLHFEAIAKETVARLAKIPNIVAVKEASGSMDQVSQIVASCRPDFAVLSGDDSLTLPMLSLGGTGVVSVVGNIAPGPMSEMVRAFRSGNLARARALHYQLFDLCRAMFVETNPIPVKTAAGILGLCSPELRLPMCPLSDANRQKLEQVLKTSPVLQPAAAS